MWRWQAMAALLVLTYVIVRISIDTSVDPASHNLWPFEILVWSLSGLGFLGLAGLFCWVPNKHVTNGGH